jgi:magnesium transporter
MKSSHYEISDAGRLRQVDLEECIADWQSGTGHYWLDVEHYAAEELESLLDRLGVTAFLKRHCLDTDRTTCFLPLPKATFLDVTVFEDRECSQSTALTFLSLDRLLVSIHQTEIDCLSRARSIVIDDIEIGDHGASATLCKCLFLHAESIADAVRKVSGTIHQTDQKIYHDPGNVELKEILDLKDDLRALDAVVDEQSACVELILSVSDDSALDFGDVHKFMKLVAATTHHADRAIDRQAKQVADLHHRYELHQQEKTNHRLGILTVLSAIFLPLTLLAGLWGMNFDGMPLIHFAHGYPIAVASMAVIAAGLTWYFYKRGWFS